ncbi:hypothetical protein D9M72_452350 [compost metagenome]
MGLRQVDALQRPAHLPDLFFGCGQEQPAVLQPGAFKRGIRHQADQFAADFHQPEHRTQVRDADDFAAGVEPSFIQVVQRFAREEAVFQGADVRHGAQQAVP